MNISVSAPGKVVILGEYAVLEGAPALVMAVDRRVSVRLQGRADDECVVTAPGLTDARGRLRLGADGPRWLEGDAATFRLATHVIGALIKSGELDPSRPAFDLVLDSKPLVDHDAGHKLGLGASAALSVALYQALRYHDAGPGPSTGEPCLARLVRLHAGAQGNRGSGLDVAASLVGGLVEYQRAPAPRALPARLPDGLGRVFVWTGQHAATDGFLARIDAWRRRDAAAYHEALAALTQTARAGAAAARNNDGETFLASLDACTTALEALGEAADTDILSPPHRRLRSLARRHGVAYKPCGAGGGDIGVGMAWHSGALNRFRHDLVAEGFKPLSLNMEPQGVTTRSGN